MSSYVPNSGVAVDFLQKDIFRTIWEPCSDFYRQQTDGSSSAWINLLKNARTKAKHVAPYSSQSNRLAERIVQTIKKAIMRITAGSKKMEWSNRRVLTELSSTEDVLRILSFFVLYGQQCRYPRDRKIINAGSEAIKGAASNINSILHFAVLLVVEAHRTDRLTCFDKPVCKPSFVKDTFSLHKVK